MVRLLAVEGFRIGRHRLSQLLVLALVIIVALQLNAKLDRLTALEAQLGSEPAGTGQPSPAEARLAQDRLEYDLLRVKLRFPAVVGYGAQLSAVYGWFLLIVLAAVLGSEDLSRRTLRPILARGVGRTTYLAALCLALWLAAGLAIVVVSLWSSIHGLIIHARVTADPIAWAGLGDASLVVLRSWLACLPLIVATVWVAVLARGPGPAVGLSVSLHAFEYLSGTALPLLALAEASGGSIPAVFSWPIRLLSVMIGYSAEVLLHWGSPFLRSVLAASTPPPLLEDTRLLPTDPWRAVALLTGYTLVCFGLASRTLRRRDLTGGG